MADHDDTPETDPDARADELEHDADEMQQRSEDVQKDIGQTRQDWQSKRRDPSEAGAVPPPEGEEDTGPGAPPASEDAGEQG